MDDVAMAIADPIRRAIVEALVGGPRPAGELAAMFPISRPAISRHLRVLRECGLVTDRKVGRHRVYEYRAEGMRDLVNWMTSVVSTRSGQGRFDFDALETEVARAARDRRLALAEEKEFA
jgi:DNA-binding transcriptional ArsR family regulator